MRFALVLPLLARVAGHRTSLVLARELARRHDVTVYAHTLADAAGGEVRRLLGSARLTTLRTVAAHGVGRSELLGWQAGRRRDRALAKRLHADHRAAPIDAILVDADEGHWLGSYVRAWPDPARPATGVCLVDLPEHTFLQAAHRDYPALRRLAAPAYPLVHSIEAGRLAAFDLWFGNSAWTSMLTAYFYGRPTDGDLVAFDDELFRPPDGAEGGEPYLALPTASLDARGLAAVDRLRRAGVPFRAFGPLPAPGVPHAGFVPDAELVRLLAGARGTLFLFDYEALGLLPLESLAVGTPVVTEPKQGPYEEYRGMGQVRFASGDAELLEACRRLLAAPKTAEVARACRADVERYRPAPVAARLAATFRAFLDRRAGTPPS